MTRDYGLLSAYLALGIQALTPIALGSFKSLKASPSNLSQPASY